MKKKIHLVSSLFLLLCITTGLSQEAVKPRVSPLAIITMRYKDAYVKITYSQPHKRGRTIFGGLVPYGQVWRTGANEATELTLTHDILFNATVLKAGTYSLFTIPDKIKWTIIINKEVGLWGSYNYNPKLDILRFDVPIEKIKTPYEAFTMTFYQKNDQAILNLWWDDVKVSVPIKFIN